MEAPQQITPTKLGDYLEVMTKAVFQGFDPLAIANLTPDEIDALTNDTRIIRNRRKIEATVHNAETMIALDKQSGGFRNYLRSEGDFWTRVADLRRRFKHVGDFGAYYFLYVVGEEVPEHHEFRAKLLEGAKKERPVAARR